MSHQNKNILNENRQFFQKTSYATGEIKPINDEISELFWIRPSQIATVGKRNNLTCAYGSFENEQAAFLICKFFAEKDLWVPVSRDVLTKWVKEHKENDYSVQNNLKRFFNDPCFVKKAFRSVQFTNQFIERCAGFRGKDENSVESWKVETIFELT